MKKTDIYLGKNGESYGPFSHLQYQKFCADGTIQSYSWVWNHDDNAWDALDPAPALLTSARTPTEETRRVLPQAHSAGIQPAPQLQAVPSMQYKRVSSGIEAICLDSHHLAAVPGNLEQVFDGGCTILSYEKGSRTPAELGVGSKIIISLMNTKTGQAMNVPGNLIRVSRNQEAGWSYEVKWAQLPSLLR
jgi:hypothetical protein